MKITIIGADGQLGSDLMKEFPWAIWLIHKDFDIKTWELPTSDIVINTVSLLNNQSDDPNIFAEINVKWAERMMKQCEAMNAQYIRISTDMVFSGKNWPYTENSLPDGWNNIYGDSKLLWEQAILAYPKTTIVRTSSIYWERWAKGKWGKNFITIMLALAKENKEINVDSNILMSNISTPELAKAIRQIIDKKIYGITHAVFNWSCSWYEFAKEIFSIKWINANLHSKESNFKNTTLANNRLEIHKDWKEWLKEFLSKFYL